MNFNANWRGHCLVQSMVRNYTFYIILIASLLSNFQSHAHFSQVPENIYEFEMQMVEHSIGTGITMRFLLNRSAQNSIGPYFPLLMQYPELIIARAEQHDLSKFAHTPGFVKKYYPEGTTTHLSAPVLKYYGYDIRTNPDSLQPEQIAEAKNAFKELNTIDDRLLDELVEKYGSDRNLSEGDVAELKKELYQFEHMSDLLNRKMFENILRFRKNFGRDASTREIFEFGRPIVLDNGNKNDWNSGEHTKRIALTYIHSPALYTLILAIHPSTVIKTYLDATKNSPFLQTDEAIKTQNLAIDAYIGNRETMAPIETKLAKRKTPRPTNLCRSFY